jgi:hypothetical protein
MTRATTMVVVRRVLRAPDRAAPAALAEQRQAPEARERAAAPRALEGEESAAPRALEGEESAVLARE